MRIAIAFLLALCCICIAAPANAARDGNWVSFPALSPDGQWLYFTAWGDIWRTAVDGSTIAVRLTDNVAYDGRPTVSPDGSQVAFLSDRFGNYDIYVMTADGADTKRLTFDSNIDYVYDWRPDGGAVLEYAPYEDVWAPVLWEVPLDGTQPRRLSGPDHNDNVFGSYLGDAQHIVYSRGPGDWARKKYRGSQTYDLWQLDVASGLHTQLTNFNGKDAWPQPSPDGSKVYFVSDRDGTENIWVLDVASSQQTQLTHFNGDGPRWPRISGDSNHLTFTVFGEPYVMDLPSGEPRKVPIIFSGDPKQELRLSQDRPGGLTEYKVSPNGKYFALVTMGDLYLLKNPDTYKPEDKPDQDLSRAFRLTTTSGREWQLSWNSDSNKLAYISDRSGEYDVYLYDLVTRTETQLTNTPQDEWIPQFAPAGNTLAYYCGNTCLTVQDVDKKTTFVLATGRMRNGPFNLGFEWSPDGKWLTYSMSTIDWRPDVFIASIDDKKSYNVSQNPDWDSGGTFSRDGKWLAWTHEMDNGAEVMLLELSPKEKKYDLDLLFPEDKPKADAKQDASKAEGAKPASPADAAKSEGPKPVKIDLERIHLRAEPVTQMQGNAYDPHFDPNSKYILFTSEHSGEREYWTVTVDDDHNYSQVGPADGRDDPQWSADGGKLYLLAHGTIIGTPLSGGKPAGGPAPVQTTERVDYDQYAIWDQMLQEGWRALRDGFYDPKLNAVDWNAVLARYRPRVQELGTYDEFNNLMREMLGELNASHLGFFGGGSDSQSNDVTADFGVDWDESFAGPGWRVAKVIEDGPAYKEGSRLYVGDVVLSVNGTSVDAQTNKAKVLNNLQGQPVVLEVRHNDATQKVTIAPVPVGAMGQLRYEQWVDDNRAKVYAETNSRIAYQHIQGMNQPSLEKFRRELFTESRGKQALIIDVRFNGGGNIHEQLIDILDRRAFGFAQYRDAERFQQPALRWEGPIVVLINPASFSDAEIFPHIMKELGLATIIGEPTGGNVIGTYDFQLLNGSTFRMPNNGWWLLSGVNMEGNGAQPDIYVQFDPNTAAKGGDNQLDAAVDYLMEKIGS